MILVPTLSKDVIDFPNTTNALKDPNGLLAIGGDLSPKRLIEAYKRGIFPWYGYNEPIMWWAPDPRMVIFPDKLKVSKSLKKIITNKKLKYSIDKDFKNVILNCQKTRQINNNLNNTWILDEMIEAYTKLHELNIAHSIEIYNDDDKLVGGLYGLLIDKVFYGESMFNLEPNASKVALYYLCNWLLTNSIEIIDCQVENDFLKSLGAICIKREQFEKYLPDIPIK